MKKKLAFMCLALMVVVGGISNLFADVNGIITFNPTFEVNSIPNAPISYDGGVYKWDRTDDAWNKLDSDWWMKSQDYWLLAYNKPSFLDLGFEVNTKNFNLVTRFDFIQDPFANMSKRSSINTNIPFMELESI